MIGREWSDLHQRRRRFLCGRSGLHEIISKFHGKGCFEGTHLHMNSHVCARTQTSIALIHSCLRGESCSCYEISKMICQVIKLALGHTLWTLHVASCVALQWNYGPLSPCWFLITAKCLWTQAQHTFPQGMSSFATEESHQSYMSYHSQSYYTLSLGNVVLCRSHCRHSGVKPIAYTRTECICQLYGHQTTHTFTEK